MPSQHAQHASVANLSVVGPEVVAVVAPPALVLMQVLIPKLAVVVVEAVTAQHTSPLLSCHVACKKP